MSTYVEDYKGEPDRTPSLREFLHGGSREDALDISKYRLFLVVDKRQSLDQSLISYTLEAVSQAIALLRSARCITIARFTSSSEHCIPAFWGSISVYLMGRYGFSLSRG